MKTGKVSESILKRSILKQIHTKREEVLLGAAVGEDCAALRLAAGEIFVLSTDPITAAAKDIGALAITVSLNDIASAGAAPVGVMITALLPVDMEEPQMRQMMQQAEEVCHAANVQIMGGHTEITPAVNQPILSVTAVGKVKEGCLVSTGGARPGMDILMTKWAGLEGTSILAKETETQLCTRFPRDFVRTAQDFDRMISVLPEAAAAVRSGVGAMHDVTEGGIFGALWEMAEASGVGLEIDLKKIPLKQETVEICEYFGLNPYELISSGALLLAAKDGNRLVIDLAKEGIAAAVIGKATDSNDRLLYNDGEKRFLEPPKTDQIYQVKRETNDA